MKWISRRRPSPAMVIATIALFISLSGVSYGVATGFIDSREIKNNEVRSLDIRNNQIRTRDLRNNEVRGIDIRNSTVQGRDLAMNTVTGEDVNEGALGKVPSAAAADSATTAGSADSAGSVTWQRQISAILTEGQQATLLTHGPLRLIASCSGGAGTTAQLRADTTEDNSVAGAEMEAADIDAADGPTLIADTQDGAAAEPPVADLHNIFGVAPDGPSFTGDIMLLANAAGSGQCRFAGHVALHG